MPPASPVAEVAPTPTPPPGIAASRFAIGADEYAVLEWPTRLPEMPKILSAAEREVLTLLLRGLSNVEIGVARGTAPRTAANQIASIFTKLKVRSRLELFAMFSRR